MKSLRGFFKFIIMESRNITVVKVGTDTITRGNGRLSLDWMEDFAGVLKEFMRETLSRVILVSSGAVGAGRMLLGERGDVADGIAGKQVLASLGQPELMRYWKRAFGHDQLVAQFLLDVHTFKVDKLRNNFKNSLLGVLGLDQTLPILNENDVQVVEALKFGDNDQLAAHVTGLVRAQRLILLTNVDGLYDKNPNDYMDAKLVSEVRIGDVDDRYLLSCAGTSNGGTGGMRSKLLATSLAAQGGADTVIAGGVDLENVARILRREVFIGTRVF